MEPITKGDLAKHEVHERATVRGLPWDHSLAAHLLAQTPVALCSRIRYPGRMLWTVDSMLTAKVALFDAVILAAMKRSMDYICGGKYRRGLCPAW